MTAREVSTGMWFTSFSFYSSRQLLSRFNFSIFLFFIFHTLAFISLFSSFLSFSCAFFCLSLHLILSILVLLTLLIFCLLGFFFYFFGSWSPYFFHLISWQHFHYFHLCSVLYTGCVFLSQCHVAYFLWVHGVIVKVLKWLFYKFPYTVKLVPIMHLSITELVWLNVLTNTKTQFSFRSLVWIL